MKCMVCRGQMIVHPQSFAPRPHQPGAPQISKVAGDFGLGLVQDGGNITHAKLTLRK